MKADDIVGILEKHDGESGGLISILEAIQAKYSYLPEEALKLVAKETGRPLVDIYGVATFYRSFSLKPRGKHLLSVCLGTACHVRNAPSIAKEVQKQLGVKPGETTPDKEFTFETVNCLGACALGPIVVIDGHYFSNVKASMVKDIIEKAQKGLDNLGGKAGAGAFPIEVGCPHCNHTLMDETHYIDGYPSVRVTVSFGRLHGWLRLSCLYGRTPVTYEHLIPKDAVVNFFCPHCHTELNGASHCADCGAPMVPMIVRQGGIVQICSRRGCKGHILDLTGVNI
jgi:NADH:ubiquinone oxidoreductase subunit E